MCDQFGFSEACASSAAEETCDTCPLDPSGCGNYVHKDNPRPCGSVSGGNDNPKGNLVLEAIDSAMLKPKGNKWYHQSGREEFRPSYANEALMKVKAIYLQHHPQGPDVAGRTTKYYTCPRCFAPIDMTGTGLDGLVATGNGGEFDAVMRRHYQIMNNSLLHVSKNFRDRQDVIDAARLDIENAHNADRAADKQRIAELEAQLAEWKSRLTAVMPKDMKCWHQNSEKEWPEVAAWVIENQRKHIDKFWMPRVEYLEKQVSGLEAHLVKARHLLERVVGLHVAPHDCYSTGPYFGDARDAGCPSCEALRWLELEEPLPAAQKPRVMPCNAGKGGWSVSYDILQSIKDRQEVYGFPAGMEEIEGTVLSLVDLGWLELEKQVSGLEAQLSAAQKPRVMKRWGVDGKPKVDSFCWLKDGESDRIFVHKISEWVMENEKAYTFPITHWLELEPTPTLPKTSDDMIAGDGDA